MHLILTPGRTRKRLIVTVLDGRERKFEKITGKVETELSGFLT